MVASILSNENGKLKCEFKFLLPGEEGFATHIMSQHILGSRPTICGPLE